MARAAAGALAVACGHGVLASAGAGLAGPRTVAEPWPQRWLARHRSAVDLVVLSLVLAYNQIVMPTVVTTASGLWMAEGLCAGLGLCWLLRRRSARVASR